MKIDNYTLNMHAHNSESRVMNRTFIEVLEIENSQRSEKVRSIEEQVEFTKRLEYELINQLISRIGNRSIRPMSHLNFKDCRCVEFKPIETKTIESTTLFVREEYKHSEKLDVSMNGFIQSGNKKIELDINLFFSNSYIETHSIEKTMFYDPLVLNFEGDIPELDSKTFNFDIDMNGESDQISMLKQGSGFLALDRNENGYIDDGFELFGTQNGNGFLDLKRYDFDGNNWIDENDDIFDKLRIWKKTDKEDTLLALGELGIGALYLGHAKGEIDIRDSENVLGKVKANGLYLNEDGTSGLLTQIDFAKHNDKSVDNKRGLNELIQSV